MKLIAAVFLVVVSLSITFGKEIVSAKVKAPWSKTSLLAEAG